MSMGDFARLSEMGLVIGNKITGISLSPVKSNVIQRKGKFKSETKRLVSFFHRHRPISWTVDKKFK